MVNFHERPNPHSLTTKTIRELISHRTGFVLPDSEPSDTWWNMTVSPGGFNIVSIDSQAQISLLPTPEASIPYTLSFASIDTDANGLRRLVSSRYSSRNGALLGVGISTMASEFPDPSIWLDDTGSRPGLWGGERLPAQYGARTASQQYHQIMRPVEACANPHTFGEWTAEMQRAVLDKTPNLLTISDPTRRFEPTRPFIFRHGPYTYDERTNADIGLSVVHEQVSNHVYVSQRGDTKIPGFTYTFPANLELAQ